MGGMQVLQFVSNFPEKTKTAIPIACTSSHSAQNIAFNELGRQAIAADHNWSDGNYNLNNTVPDKGLAVARMAAHITYLSKKGLQEKFGRKLQERDDLKFGFDADFQIESYLRYQGSVFVDRFDANSYLYITRAMDYFDLVKQFNGNLSNAFKNTKTKFFIISFTSDWLYPTQENKDIVIALNAIGADVDFEMYGKDLIESAILSSKIIKLIGKTNPSGFAYELFLDEKGEKISKSKGNGITIDQWLEYASPESLSLYMYQNPKRAKKLYKEIVPKAVDEYLDFIEKAKTQNELQLLMNPVWHVHNSRLPKENSIMSFSMLLNLVETSNADNKELLWKFVKKYKSSINEKDHPIFDNLIGYAIKYFNDVIKIKKKYKKPNTKERLALQALVNTLDKCDDKMKPEDIQTMIYSTGKENGYSENLRDWFKLIYEVVFGHENGPRMGFFISFFGVKETKDLIINKIK